MNIRENDFEQFVISKLTQKKYKHLSSIEILNLREENSEVLLKDEFFLSIKKINKKNDISEDIINKVWRKVKDLASDSLEKANEEFHNFLVNGIRINNEKAQRTITYKLFDFKNLENNSFIVTNQFNMKSNHVAFERQIPDVVIYINGMPLIVMELKTPNSINEDILLSAFKQIKAYQRNLSTLFVYNAFNVISNYSETKVGTLTSTFERYKYWRGEDYSLDSNNIFDNLFDKKIILDVIRKYIFFSRSDSANKIMASYHQYYGVCDAIKSVTKGINNASRKGGIFWHTQGSGKSLSMVFFIKNFSDVQPKTTFLIVTDRNDLDDQIYKTFLSSRRYLSQKIHKIESIQNLKHELKDIKQDGVFFTTVQKFNNDVKLLTTRDDIVVITDEAHRSHNNIEKFHYIDEKTAELIEKQSYAYNLRNAFPNATFLGFTGTPIETNDKSTSEVFGKFVNKYLLEDAIRDKVIVPINFELRRADLQLDEQGLAILDNKYISVRDEIIAKINIPNEVIKKQTKKIQKVENFILNENRIKGIAKDFVEHYNNRKDLILGKAMFVCINRHAAYKLYQEIIKIDSNFKSIMKLIMTESNKDDDEMSKLVGNKKYRNEMAVKFKQDTSNFKIAIVVDMWLTGFDVPSLDTLYIDKPLKMHNLMQTIARVNRVYSNTSKGLIKTTGLVVDYIGISKRLKEAIEFYSGQATRRKKLKLKDISEKKKEYVESTKKIFENFLSKLNIDFNRCQTDNDYKFEILNEIYNEIARQTHEEDKSRMQAFISVTQQVYKWLQMITTSLTEDEKAYFVILSAARKHIISKETSKLEFMNFRNELQTQLKNTIRYISTIKMDSVDGKQISILDLIQFIKNPKPKTYLEKDKKLVATNMLLEKLKRINIIKSEKLSNKLNKILQKYEDNFITMEELLNELYKISEEAQSMLNNSIDKEMGYKENEMAFFNILFEPVKDEFDKNKIKEILDELLGYFNNEKIEHKKFITGSFRRDIRSKIKKLLIKHDYPPEDSKTSASTIVEQLIKQNNYKEV